MCAGGVAAVIVLMLLVRAKKKKAAARRAEYAWAAWDDDPAADAAEPLGTGAKEE